jgi:phenylacetate-CoA ligase
MTSGADLYPRLPIALQHAACSIEGWRRSRRVLGTGFRELLDAAEARARWSDDRIRAFRDERLAAFVRHAAETVPYYRRVFSELGLDPARIRSLEDLGPLPVIAKEGIQDRARELRSDAVPARARLAVRTSGTTGAGLELLTTREALREQWAVWWRWWRSHGIEPGTWCGYFSGQPVVAPTETRPPFWRINLPGRQVRFSRYHLSPVALDADLAEIRRRRIPWLHGHPSVIAVLAERALDTGADLRGVVRWVTTGSSVLLRSHVEIVERAFGVRPRQHYGMVEAVANASECEEGLLHLDEDFAAVELLPNPDGPGSVVVGTSFTNLAMPLLRYRLGDLVTPAAGSCPCGRPGRLLASVDGRCDDFVVLSGGARAVGLSWIFKNLVNVREAQIYQARPGAVTIRIVAGPGYSTGDEAALLEQARRHLGETEVKVEYVEAIERSPSGKTRLVVSALPDGRG